MAVPARFVNGLRLGSGGPTVTTGTAAPSAAEPNGSIYVRTGQPAATSLYQRAEGAWVALATAASLGTLSSLTTSAKSSVVAAINELVGRLPGGAGLTSFSFSDGALLTDGSGLLDTAGRCWHNFGQTLTAWEIASGKIHAEIGSGQGGEYNTTSANANRLQLQLGPAMQARDGTTTVTCRVSCPDYTDLGATPTVRIGIWVTGPAIAASSQHWVSVNLAWVSNAGKLRLSSTETGTTTHVGDVAASAGHWAGTDLKLSWTPDGVWTGAYKLAADVSYTAFGSSVLNGRFIPTHLAFAAAATGAHASGSVHAYIEAMTLQVSA